MFHSVQDGRLDCVNQCPSDRKTSKGKGNELKLIQSSIFYVRGCGTRMMSAKVEFKVSDNYQSFSNDRIEEENIFLSGTTLDSHTYILFNLHSAIKRD